MTLIDIQKRLAEAKAQSASVPRTLYIDEASFERVLADCPPHFREHAVITWQMLGLEILIVKRPLGAPALTDYAVIL